MGIRIIRPGPFTGISLPSLKITPLSYSRRTLMILKIIKPARKTRNTADENKLTGMLSSFK
jgi:hypothetical protein